MKIKFYCLLLLVLGILFSSCSENTKEEYVQVIIKNSSYKKAYLYGFLGEDQILIDSIKLDNNELRYPISEKCNVGVYRIQFSSNDFIDFIYNNENVKIEVDKNDFIHSIKIEESEENKILYNYLNKLQLFQEKVIKNQKYIQSVRSLKKKEIVDSINLKNKTDYNKIYSEIYGLKSNKNYLAYSIIQLLDMPNYDLYVATTPKSEILSQPDFLSKNCFQNGVLNDERLLATPYFYISIRLFLEQFLESDSLYLNNVIEKMHLKSINNIYISEYLDNFFYEYLFEKKYDNNLDFYMKKNTIEIYKHPEICMENRPVHVNEIVSKYFYNKYSKAKLTLFFLCDSMTHSDKELIKTVQLFKDRLVSKSINVWSISSFQNKLWTKYSVLLNIRYTPALVIIDAQGKLKNRIFGKNKIIDALSNLSNEMLQ